MYTVRDLIKYPFSLRSLEEKLDIVEKGRPTPPLPNLTTQHKTKSDKYLRHFSISQYENVEWLTGCEISCKLFCWPCLLFSNKNEVWSKHGFADLNHLSGAQQKHSKSQTHLHCFLQFKFFGKKHVDLVLDHQHRDDLSKHNEEVKKNRTVLIRIIDAICLLANQELPLRRHDESENSLNKGNFSEFLNVLKKYDSLLENNFNSATVFWGTSTVIQNDIIRAIADVVREEIKKELNSVSFVSIMLDETSDIVNKSQLSTVLRYVKDSNVYERFVGFTDVSANRTSEGLFVHIQQIVSEFEIANKLVCQTYDGATVMNGHVNCLQSKVLTSYPNAIFTHCYAHELNLVLQQSLSIIKECRSFFQSLGGVPKFFQKSSNRAHALQEYLQKKLPTVDLTTWNFTSQLCQTVKEYRPHLCEFFEIIITNSEDWDSETVIKSRGFLSFLQEFQSIFLLEVFSKVFTQTDVLNSILQTDFDVLNCCEKVNNTKDQLRYDREHSFLPIWENTISINTEYYESKPKRHCPDNSEQENNYRRLYIDIIDCLIHQIDCRFSQLEKLEYFKLLYKQNYLEYQKTFPESLLKKVTLQYGHLFDHVGLKNELYVLYSSSEFHGRDVHKLINFLFQNGLSSGFFEVYKLALLIMTIPSNISCVERSISALQRINTYLHSTQNQERLNNLSLLSIEKELVRKLKMNDSFYSAVIEKFASQETRVELLFKNE